MLNWKVSSCAEREYNETIVKDEMFILRTSYFSDVCECLWSVKKNKIKI